MTEERGFTRRDVLASAGAIALAAMVSDSEAAESGHHHHAMAGGNSEVASAALDCVTHGQACIAHCAETFKSGDLTMAQCNYTVHISAKMCDTLATLALNNSPHLKDFAKICIETCKDCETECRKHEKTVKECKMCADACAKCIDACKKIVG